MIYEPKEIILIEDNSCDVDLTVRAFSANHFSNSIHIIDDGVEALDFFFGNNDQDFDEKIKKIKLVLLDIHLPRVNGLEILRRLKFDDKTKHIPVVILSASNEYCDIEEAYDLCVNSYIVKPLDYTEFLENIQTIGSYWLSLNQPVEKNEL